MPRKNRYFTAGGLWHVTHRCHNRDFLLRFSRDRDAYRSLLRERMRSSGVDLYAYCVTSNHENCWTESLAVGCREFVERMAGTLRNRRELEFVYPQTPGAPVVLRERGMAGYVTA